MEMVFAVIGFLAVVGGLLWYWNSLEGDVRHPASGRKHSPAEQRDWERVKEARRKEGGNDT
jgi:hypothetical protein